MNIDYDGLKKFLIKHSNIDVEFMKDFFFIQKNDEYKNHKPFIIDLDTLCKWINIQKRDFKTSLLKNYKKDVDYVFIEKIKTKGRPLEKYLLTVRCFKKLCIRSNSKNGDKIIDYYLQLEEIIDRYKNDIIIQRDEMIHNLKVENNFLESKHRFIESKSGYIYIYQSKCTKNGIDTICYKYGKTANMKKIIRKYQTGNPGAEMICYIPLDDTGIDMNLLEDGIDILVRKNAVKHNHETTYYDSIDQLKNKILDCARVMKLNDTEEKTIEYDVKFIYIENNLIEVYRIIDNKYNYLKTTHQMKRSVKAKSKTKTKSKKSDKIQNQNLRKKIKIYIQKCYYRWDYFK